MIQQPSNKTMMLFSGSSNTKLSNKVADHLKTQLIDLEVKTFASGEEEETVLLCRATLEI